jgi:hypothetical protein
MAAPEDLPSPLVLFESPEVGSVIQQDQAVQMTRYLVADGSAEERQQA